MHAFPFQIHPCSVSEKSCSKKISPTSQHKLPDSEILSFFLSHKTQHPSVSFPSNHHWSIPCRYLCACKTRVRKCAQAPGEGRLLVVIHSHKSQTRLCLIELQHVWSPDCSVDLSAGIEYVYVLEKGKLGWAMERKGQEARLLPGQGADSTLGSLHWP